MPELPEVETMRRGIRSVVGSRVTDVARVRCKLKPILVRPGIRAFRKRVEGQAIVDVGRIGKRVLLHLERGDIVVFEPRMTGLVLLADPPDVEHLRFSVELSGGDATQLWYWDRRGLGSVHLFSPVELQQALGPAKLGPDALEVTAADLRRRLRASRRAVKVALLDQRVLAGVGNLYASELLNVARIHPQRPCHRLTRREWERVASALHEVLEEAIRYEGSTLSDGTYRNALNAPGSYQNHHRVYGREGKACRSCGRRPVRRIVQAQRATFFCPNCQSGRRPK
jgi:formamidopyrimidine-DNA glycosylase